jgi:transcriptional regulator of arginine metabolism
MHIIAARRCQSRRAYCPSISWALPRRFLDTARALPRLERDVSDKSTRHTAIRELIGEREVASQEELRKLLRQRGWDVTQSTLSRDLRELRLARIPDGHGSARYAFPDAAAGEDLSPQIEQLLPQMLIGVEAVQVLVVARTVPSAAQPVAAALDGAGWSDVLGTIAGDDTVLLICRSAAARERVVRRLKPLLRSAA